MTLNMIWNNFGMDEPWGTNNLSDTDTSLDSFEDNFVTTERLPDSRQYLEGLGIIILNSTC